MRRARVLGGGVVRWAAVAGGMGGNAGSAGERRVPAVRAKEISCGADAGRSGIRGGALDAARRQHLEMDSETENRERIAGWRSRG